MFCFFFLGYYGGHPIACSLWLCTFFKLKTFLAKVTKHTSADMLWITSAHALDYLCSCFKLPLYMIWITSAHALDHLCTCFELPLHMLWITSAHALDHLCTYFGSPLQATCPEALQALLLLACHVHYTVWLLTSNKSRSGAGGPLAAKSLLGSKGFGTFASAQAAASTPAAAATAVHEQTKPSMLRHLAKVCEL